MARCSSKMNELRDIDSIGCRRGTSPSKNGKMTFLVETILLEIDKCKSKNANLVSQVLALLSWSSEGYI